jgi:P4 family phage/plasmid primase-like protien
VSDTNGAADTLAPTLSWLLPQYVADLRKSGLSDEQITLCGFTSYQTADTVQKVLRWKRYKGELGPCLVIPFNDVEGKPTGFTRLKPDKPRIKDGKPVKYESPKGSTNAPYFPPWTRTVLHDVAVSLTIVEGEKKAAKGDQEHIPCIGLVGVDGWSRRRAKDENGQPRGERELIAGLAAVAWKGRLVYICFDSDAVSNRNVRRAEWALAQVLARHGAIVLVVRLPEGEPAKVGLDDYLVAHGPDAFRELLAAAKPAEPPVGVAPIEAADDPHRLARLFVKERCEHADGLTLRFWREEWHRWDGTRYRVIPDVELNAELTASVKAEMDRLNLLAQLLAAAKGEKPPAARKVTRGLVGNAQAALASLAVLPGVVEQPAWLTNATGERRNLVALTNGLLDLDALFAGQTSVLLPHSPRWFSAACLPYSFDADALCPRWQAFLQRNLKDDSERIALLQEWFGLCLVRDTDRQKFLLMEGEGANGKSVVCAAMEATLGSDNCSHVPLEMFGERFQLTVTLGKLANIATEVGELDKAAEGYLKSFTSGEVMQFDRKFKPPVNAPATARLVLATNNRPRFSDRSGGLWRRMILVPFRVVIAEDDPTRVFGMDKTEWWQTSGELPGILNWALAGLDRLRRRNRFTESEVCDEALAEYRTENNPARMFLLDTCREYGEGLTACDRLYQAYRTWCLANGYSPLADRAFGKEVRRVFPKVARRGIGSRGCRTYTYCGIASDQMGH